jgi:hypothetical protein
VRSNRKQMRERAVRQSREIVGAHHRSGVAVSFMV